MSSWRALARELGVLPPLTKPTELTKPNHGLLKCEQETTLPWVSSVLSVLSVGEKPISRDLARKLFEEGAAILEHEGGLPRREAERPVRAQTGIEDDAGSTPAEPMRPSDTSSEAPCRAPERSVRPFTKPATPEKDALAMLAILARKGPMSYGVAARALGWGATRAWQADTRLEAAGRIRHDHLGRMVPLPAEGAA